jgi:two-component system OmpR family response regulator
MSQNAHILVVDSDQHSRGLLNECLQSSGYRVTAVTGGHGMRRVLDRTRVDLVVLDVQLPGEDGLTLCRDVRGRAHIPVMILSRLADEIDRIIGLEIGADDYVSKPFNPREFVSRMKAILRCTLNAGRPRHAVAASSYVFGSWRLSTVERLLEHADGTRVALTDAEFGLLLELLAEAPRPLSRGRLLERLCGRSFHPADRSIDVRVSRLRQLLRDDARTPTIIKTMHGKGYGIGVGVARD